MTPPVPQNPAISGDPDFDKFEDFILEEYMDMACEDNEPAKSSGPVHPIHFRGISLEDESFLTQNLGAVPETDRSAEQKSGHRQGGSDQHDSPRLETPITTKGNSSSGVTNMKTGTPLNEQISKMPYNCSYQELFHPEECDGRFETFNHAEHVNPEVAMTSALNFDQGLPRDPNLKFMDMEQEAQSEGNSSSLGELWDPEMTNPAESGSTWWNDAQMIDLDSSSEALPDLFTQAMQPQDPYVGSQITPKQQSLAGQTHLQPHEIEIGFISSDDSIPDSLIIDELREKEFRRPSVIVQPPYDAPMDCYQHNVDSRLKEAKPSEPANIRNDLQPQQTLPPSTSFYPDHQFEVCTQTPWDRGSEPHDLKYSWPVTCSIPSRNDAAWGNNLVQDRAVFDQKNSRLNGSGYLDGKGLHQQNSYDDQSYANSANRYDSPSGVADPSLNQHHERVTMGPSAHSVTAMRPQPYNHVTVNHEKLGDFYNNNGQRLPTNFSFPNELANPGTAPPPEPGLAPRDTAFEALASIGLFPYPCNDPNCPGDISRQFQEFPFPRRKSTSSSLSRHYPILMSPMPSSTGSDGTLSEMFEVEPNQEEQRLLLRRIRNREAAKRCRKKKKQEFIALLFKRAMLLAEYHRCYHTHHQNTMKI